MIADDYEAIRKAQKALEAKPEPKVDVMEPLFMPMTSVCEVPGWKPPSWLGDFVPHDPVVPPCDSGE